MTANSNPNAKSNTNTSVFINHPLRDIQRRYKRMCSLINTLKIMLGWLRRYYPRSCIYFYNYNNVYVLLNIFFSFVVWTFDSISGGIWKLKKFERAFFSYAFFVFFLFVILASHWLLGRSKQKNKALLFSQLSYGNYCQATHDLCFILRAIQSMHTISLETWVLLQMFIFISAVSDEFIIHCIFSSFLLFLFIWAFQFL